MTTEDTKTDNVKDGADTGAKRKNGTGENANGGRRSASKGRSAKSNKTAHVLNLLTESKDAPKKEAAALPAEPLPAEVELIDNAVLAEQIRSALESEFDGEAESKPIPSPAAPLAPASEAAQPQQSAPTESISTPAEDISAPSEHISAPMEDRSAVTAPEQPQIEQALPAAPAADASAAPQSSGGKLSQEDIERLLQGASSSLAQPQQSAPTENVSTPAEDSSTPTENTPAPVENRSAATAPAQPQIDQAPTAAPQAANVSTAPQKTSGSLLPESIFEPAPLEGFSYVNIMQFLVEQKVDKYIKMFGLCNCPRCKLDVMALALSKLPAKYIIIASNEAKPMMSVWEGRYNTAVISQVMWACKTVMDNPYHDL